MRTKIATKTGYKFKDLSFVEDDITVSQGKNTHP